MLQHKQGLRWQFGKLVYQIDFAATKDEKLYQIKLEYQ